MAGLQHELTNELQGIFEGLARPAVFIGYEAWRTHFASLPQQRRVGVFREVLAQLAKDFEPEPEDDDDVDLQDDGSAPSPLDFDSKPC